MSVITDKQKKSIEEFCPIDDTFFEVLADDEAFCQEILRVILDEDGLIVEAVTVQKDEKNLIGRSVRLDALCMLSDGTYTNIEIQKSDNDNHFKRVRYNAACITASETDTGTKFENVPNVIMVYITKSDFLNGGRTAYHVQKVVKETGEVIDDGIKEIYVNTKIDDGTVLGELMQMFNQKEANNPKFPEFTRRMNYIKHTEGGKRKMCEIMERYIEEAVREAEKKAKKETMETAVQMIKIGKLSLEEISICIPALSIEELKEIEAEVMQRV